MSRTSPPADAGPPLAPHAEHILSPLLPRLRSLEDQPPDGTLVQFSAHAPPDHFVWVSNCFTLRVAGPEAPPLQDPARVVGAWVRWVAVVVQPAGRYRERATEHATRLADLAERAGRAIASEVQPDGGPRFWAAVCEVMQHTPGFVSAGAEGGWVSLSHPLTAARIACERWLARPPADPGRPNTRRERRSRAAGEPKAGPPSPPPEPPRPCWNADTRTLSFGEWSLPYRRRAPSQEQILAAFQTAGWPERVTTGLPAHLSETVRNLNATLGEGCPLRFERDGTGEGVRWRPHASGTEVS